MKAEKGDTPASEGTIISLDMTPEQEAAYEAWLDANPDLRRGSEIAAKLISGTATPEEIEELRALNKDVSKDFIPGHIDDSGYTDDLRYVGRRTPE